MNLQLSLIRKWLDMTATGIKTEDYREITPYWCSRLLLFNGKEMPQSWWEFGYFLGGHLKRYRHHSYILDLDFHFKAVTFKPFTTNTITLGYPKSGDTDHIRRYKHAGIELREGNPEWGAEPGKIYFVIKHGEQI